LSSSAAGRVRGPRRRKEAASGFNVGARDVDPAGGNRGPHVEVDRQPAAAADPVLSRRAGRDEGGRSRQGGPARPVRPVAAPGAAARRRAGDVSPGVADALLSDCRRADHAPARCAQIGLLRGSQVRPSRSARIRAAALVLSLAAPAGPAAAQTAEPYPPLIEPLRVEQVPGLPVYYTVGNPNIPGRQNQGHTSNAGFVVTPDGVVAFDALGTPSLGWNLLKAIRAVTDKPVRYVVVSHYHADHIYGLQAFKDHSGAIIVAQERATEYRENE